MSLYNKIFSLLSNHSNKIDSLSSDEFDALRDLKRMVTSGMVGEVVSSIREYIALNPNIVNDIKPNSIGSYLLGCISSTSECSLQFQSEDDGDEYDVYVSENNELKRVFIAGKGKAHIFRNDKKLSSEMIEFYVRRDGVGTFEILELGEHDEYKAIEKEKPFWDNTSVIIILAIVIWIGAILIFNPKMEKKSE